MELHDLATGPVSPIVAMIFATLGCLLGILLVTHARRRTGMRRVRLVAYASMAMALPVVWLPALIAVLALRVDGSVLRLTPEPLGYSLGAAVGATLLALLPVCFGRPGAFRQVLAGLCLVGGIGGTGMFLALALTTGAPIVVEPTSIGVAAAIAGVTGFGLAAAVAATRTLGRAVGNATLLGLGLAGVYHVAAAALQVRPGSGGPVPADEVAGLSPQRIGLPAVIVVATILALTWYFTLGTATVRDLRLMFEPRSESEQIEPWMVEQVRARVALSSTAYATMPGWPEGWGREQPTVAVHAIQIGRGIADAFARPLPARVRFELTPAASEIPTPQTDPGAEEMPAEETAAEATREEPDGPEVESSPADPDGTQESTVDRPAQPAADDPDSADQQASPEQEPAWDAWRVVPDWGLPTSQWSQAEFDEATAYDAEPGGDDWPAPSRNEPAVARRERPATVNSRYGPSPGPVQRPVSPAPDLTPASEAEDWAARLHAAAARAAGHRNDTGVVIVREYEAASPLPRRNARPINRP